MQEIVAFVIAQSYSYHDVDPASGQTVVRTHDGYDAWDAVALGYQEFLYDRMDLEGEHGLSITEANWNPLREFLKPIYIEAGGFPMLPGDSP